jgi:hypothetical protein
MATKIVTKNSSTASAVPTASDLVQGELAVNVADKRLFTEDNGGAIVELGTNPSGNVTFQDNGKAIFGAGSDLQIYHDGGNSWVKDNGDGVLALASNGNGVGLYNADGTKPMLFGTVDADVKIYHDGNLKLATTSTGIDVTGNVTMATGGSIVAGGVNDLILNAGESGTPDIYLQSGGSTKVKIEGSNGNVGIGTSSPSTKLHLGGTAPLDSIIRQDSTVSGTNWEIGEREAGKWQIFEDDSDSIVATFMSSGNVGIGQASPTSPLHVKSGANNDNSIITIEGATNNIFELGYATAGAFLNSAAGDPMVFRINETERMRIDSSGRVGIGISSMVNPLHVGVTPNTASKTSGSAFDGGALRLDGNLANAGDESAILAGANDGLSAGIGFMRESGANWGTALKFYTHSPAITTTDELTERMRIDSSGNVGIGTSTIIGSAANRGVLTLSGASSSFLTFGTGSTRWGGVYSSASNTIFLSDSISTFETGGVERMRIDSSGNVGIGTSSPAAKAHIYDAATDAVLYLDSANVNGSHARFLASGSVKHFVGSGGGFGLGDVDDFAIRSFDNLIFATNNSSTERMRIDSSGNLLVGTTDSNVYNDASGTGTVIQSNGIMQLAANNGTPLYANRQGTDGDIIDFRKGGASVGSIGTSSGYTKITSGDGTNGSGLQFGDSKIYPVEANSVVTDNAVDFGDSTYRFKDIYATNGTIQTSDRNEKQDIAELSDAEQRVAVACKGLLRKFRWKDSVAEKGDDARIHFGIIAQDLQAAFAAEGLDAGDYAMFISTTWTDEETNEEKTRMGVRYSELLAFIIAAI